MLALFLFKMDVAIYFYKFIIPNENPIQSLMPTTPLLRAQYAIRRDSFGPDDNSAFAEIMFFFFFSCAYEMRRQAAWESWKNDSVLTSRRTLHRIFQASHEISFSPDNLINLHPSWCVLMGVFVGVQDINVLRTPRNAAWNISCDNQARHLIHTVDRLTFKPHYLLKHWRL